MNMKWLKRKSECIKERQRIKRQSYIKNLWINAIYLKVNVGTAHSVLNEINWNVHEQ